MSAEDICKRPETCPDLLVKWVPLEELVVSDRNPRKHPASQIRQLANSLTTWGWMLPLLSDPKGTVIVGEGRLLAARLIKARCAPVIVVKHLSDDQIRAYRIADNRLGGPSKLESDVPSLPHSGVLRLG
jgi:ParB-like chromosome segregation protein Spo0J